MKYLRLILSLIVMVSVIGVTSSVFAKSETSIQTVSDYTNLLKEEAKYDKEAKENLKIFKALEKDKQEKLIEYLNDSELFEDFIEASSELMVGQSINLKEGDVVVKSEKVITSEEAPLGEVGTFATTYYRKATYTASQEIFGLTITKLSSYVKYKHNGSEVTDTYDNGASVTNWNPGVGISKDVRSHYHTSSTAYSTTIWEGAFAKWSPIVSSKEQKVWGNYNNNSGGHLINL